MKNLVARYPWCINAFGVAWCIGFMGMNAYDGAWRSFAIVAAALVANAWILWHYYGRKWLKRRR